MEEIINIGVASKAKHRHVWAWEEYYVQSHRISRFIIRQLGSIIIVLALLPAVGAILVYLLVKPTPPVSQSSIEQTGFWIDTFLIAFTFLLIVIVKLINERWWKIEQEQLDKQK